MYDRDAEVVDTGIHEPIRQIVEEALRHESPVKGQFRLSRVPANVGGVDIPAGTTVMTLNGAANRDPRMGPLYTKYLQDWSNEGGGVFVHFTHCSRWDQYGRFGALEYLEQLKTSPVADDAVRRKVPYLRGAALIEQSRQAADLTVRIMSSPGDARRTAR